jgi:tRNA threonylcarbamoyladenosine biosynthesis protein TsaE
VTVATQALTLRVPTAEAMRSLGERLGSMLRAGDLVVLSGDLGAGKTTFTRGVGAGLGVRGQVTSPTFVIARVHPSLSGGPALVHVDAYRLSGWAELEDLDLEASLEESVTVVEWGAGLVEGLADDRIEIVITRAHGAEELARGDDTRTVELRGVGARWAGSWINSMYDRGA